MKLDNFLDESSKMKTKKLANNLDAHLNNVIIKTIDDWIKKNVNPVDGWDYPEQRDEVLKKVAEGQIQFFKGMLKASKGR